MKFFSIWLVITLLVFGSLSGAYHRYLIINPRYLFVAVDSSFPMESSWGQIPQLLDTLDNERYTKFSLVTEKNRIHSWASKLKLGNILPYAPRDLSKFLNSDSYPEINQAEEKLLLTNASPAETEQLKGWNVIRLSMKDD